jgi:hypothetical protein
MITRAPSRTTALVIAMGALVIGGLAQELLLLIGHPQLGPAITIPLVILVAWLWRPPWAVLGIIGVGLGIELLLPLQTGGGRYQDWVLHYQMALHYAGQPSQVLAEALRWRTPLYHQLNAGILAGNPGYWTFQVGSVLLCSLWLWPASLLIRDRAPDSTAVRLMAVALAPVVIAYSTYTWPWNFASFFVLSALWLQRQTSLIARVGVGIALGAALLAHPATCGYVLGLVLVWLYRQRTAVLPGAAAMALVLLSAVPWIVSVSGNGDPQVLVTNSVPAMAVTSPYLWALSRLLLVAHTFLPTPIPTADRFWASLALTFFALSLPGALITVFVTARFPRPPATILVCLATGAAIVTAVYNASSYPTGMLDALTPGVLILLTFVAGTLDATRVRRMFVASLVLGGCFVTLLLLLSAFPIAGDSNVTYRSQYSVIFFVQRWGLLPGLAVLAAAAGICARAATDEWRRPALGPMAG